MKCEGGQGAPALYRMRRSRSRNNRDFQRSLPLVSQGGCHPAEARDRDAGDWVLVAANGRRDAQLSQFDNPNNTRLTLLAVNGGHLYVGFDNAVEGVTVYRSAVDVPVSGGPGTPVRLYRQRD
jgi:hypothetical protein